MTTRPLPIRKRLLPTFLLLPAIALAGFDAPAAAQDPAPAAPQAGAAQEAPAHELLIQPPSNLTSTPSILDAAEVTVRYVRVESGWSRRADALASLYQRRFFVRSEDGTVMGPYASIDSFDGMVVLHDTASRVTMLSQALAQLEEAFAAGSGEQPDATATALVVREYVPRHQPVKSLLQALEPFRRLIVNAPPSGSGQGVQVSNVSALHEPALIVLRDTEANLAAMVALLNRVDVPAPQVLVRCTVLRAITPGDLSPPAPGLPAGLLAGLRALVPYQEFSQVGFAALRVAVVAGRETTLRGELSSERQFMLALEPAGYDPANGLLTLDRCRFKVGDGQEFETGVTLRAGEDTVLGASGAEPLFVVLQVTPL